MKKLHEYEENRERILREIDSIGKEIIEVSHAIHGFAEYGTLEYKSSGLLVSRLRERGFEISAPEIEPGMEKWKHGLRTAIKTTFGGKS